MYLASVLSTVIICHLPVSRRECGPSSVGLIVEFVPWCFCPFFQASVWNVEDSGLLSVFVSTKDKFSNQAEGSLQEYVKKQTAVLFIINKIRQGNKTQT